MRAILLLLLSSAPGDYRVVEDARYSISQPYQYSISEPCAQPLAATRLRLVLLKKKGCYGCDQVSRLLASDWLPDGWRQHIEEVLDDKNETQLDAHKLGAYPAFLLYNGPKLLGSVEPDIDNWDHYQFAVLGLSLYRCHLAGDAEVVPRKKVAGVPHRRNAGDAVYPLRPDWTWWTGCGHWAHMTGGVHGGKFAARWLSLLNWAELQSLHSDDHEHKVKWNFVPRS